MKQKICKDVLKIGDERRENVDGGEKIEDGRRIFFVNLMRDAKG